MVIKAFEALIDLLSQEQAIYSQMAELLDREREAMLSMATDRLDTIVSTKETLALRLKALDESRKMLANRLGSLHGLPADKVTITGLSQTAPPAVADRLRRVGARLRETVERCQLLNQFNARAARRGVEMVSGAIDHLISTAAPAGKLYSKPVARGGYGMGARRSVPGIISRQA